MKKIDTDVVDLLNARGLLATTDAEMEKNVGRAIRFKGPWTKQRLARLGTSARDNTFEIIGVQGTWNGSLAYRVIAREWEDTFGRCASPHEIDFLDN